MVRVVSSELDRKSVRLALELWQQTGHPLLSPTLPFLLLTNILEQKKRQQTSQILFSSLQPIDTNPLKKRKKENGVIYQSPGSAKVKEIRKEKRKGENLIRG